MDSSPVNVKEESSNSFAESDDKSIKSPAVASEDSDSEVERSENEAEDEEADDNKSESNDQQPRSATVEDADENSTASKELEMNENDDEEQSSMKDDQSSIKDEPDEPADSDNEASESEADKQELEEDARSDQDAKSDQEDARSDQEAKSDQEEVDSDDDISEKKVKKRAEAHEIFGHSDSENEDDEPNKANKRKLDSDENEDSDEEFFSPKKKKLARVLRDSDEERSDSDDEDEEPQPKKRKVSDAESDDELENELKELDQDDENGEQTEKRDDENAEEDDNKKVLPDISSSSEDELDDDRRNRSDLVYDFDIMMAKRKEQNARNRKRRNTDLINDSDDFIAHLLTQMKQAAEEDFELNKERKAATRKMKLLPSVQAYLRKIDLRESFLDSGVLGIIADWLTRLPDGSLPNLQVRETMLKILLEMNIQDVDRLKSSGIGKAVMYLFKHRLETKENKQRAGLLIRNWSRPIFNCETDYQSVSKEEREQRDYDLMHKVQRKKQEPEPANPAENQVGLRPGDKGWVPRARVPMPSTKDYVVRPKSTVDIEIGKSSKRQATRLDKHLRSFQEKKRSAKMQRAVKISIEGRKL